MSAKLVLTVKDSSRMAKDYSMSMMDKMFHPLKHNKILNSKAKIGILIDDEEEGTLYEASKTPYEINLQPGFHRITMIGSQIPWQPVDLQNQWQEQCLKPEMDIWI